MDTPWQNATGSTGSVQDNRSTAEIVVQAMTMALILLSATLGNILILLAIYMDKTLRTVTNVFIVNLACADLLLSVIGMPFTLVSSITYHWIFGAVWCNIHGMANSLFSVASMLTLAAVSIDRYIAIIHPLHYITRMTTRTATAMIVYIWAHSLVISLLPVIGWSRYTFIRNESICTVYWQLDISCTLFIFVVCFFVPLVVMMFTYYRVLQTARAQSRRIVPITGRISLKRTDDNIAHDWSSAEKTSFPSQASLNSECQISRETGSTFLDGGRLADQNSTIRSSTEDLTNNRDADEHRPSEDSSLGDSNPFTNSALLYKVGPVTSSQLHRNSVNFYLNSGNYRELINPIEDNIRDDSNSHLLLSTLAERKQENDVVNNKDNNKTNSSSSRELKQKKCSERRWLVETSLKTDQPTHINTTQTKTDEKVDKGIDCLVIGDQRSRNKGSLISCKTNLGGCDPVLKKSSDHSLETLEFPGGMNYIPSGITRKLSEKKESHFSGKSKESPVLDAGKNSGEQVERVTGQDENSGDVGTPGNSPSVQKRDRRLTAAGRHSELLQDFHKTKSSEKMRPTPVRESVVSFEQTERQANTKLSTLNNTMTNSHSQNKSTLSLQQNGKHATGLKPIAKLGVSLQVLRSKSYSGGKRRQNQHSRLQKFKQDKKAVRTLLIVVGTFILCWFPHFIGIFCLLTDNCPWPDRYFAITTWLAMLNSGCNPVIYGAMSRQFRKRFKQILQCKRGFF